MQLVDSHCHINFAPLCDDTPGVLKRAAENGVSHLLCISVNLEDYPQVEKLAQEHDHVFASVGVHPNTTDCFEPDVEHLLNLAANPKVVAIGETGLDYFRSEGDLSWQRSRFQTHIEAAIGCNKPLIIHTRAAADDTMDMLETLGADQCGGVLHCFSEDWKTAKRALDIGFYISFSGILTFKNAENLRDIASKVPEDRMLIETDSPYLAPVPFRGKTNEPSYVLHVAEKLAQVRKMSLDEVAIATTANFFSLFSAANNRL